MPHLIINKTNYFLTNDYGLAKNFGLLTISYMHTCLWSPIYNWWKCRTSKNWLPTMELPFISCHQRVLHNELVMMYTKVIKSSRLLWTLWWVGILRAVQLSCWISNSKWIRKPCNSNIWIISQYLKSKVPMTHHGHIGASIGVVHLAHAPPFAWYKVLLQIT